MHKRKRFSVGAAILAVACVVVGSMVSSLFVPMGAQSAVAAEWPEDTNKWPIITGFCLGGRTAVVTGGTGRTNGIAISDGTGLAWVHNALHAVQIGTGSNVTANTFKYRAYTIVNADGTLGLNLGAAVVAGTNIAENAITSYHLAVAAVAGTNVAESVLNSYHLAVAGVAGTNIAENAIGNYQLGVAAVAGTNVAENAIAGYQLAVAAVGGTNVAENAIGSYHLAALGVAATNIAENAIGNYQLGDCAVTYVNSDSNFISIVNGAISVCLTNGI